MTATVNRTAQSKETLSINSFGLVNRVMLIKVLAIKVMRDQQIYVGVLIGGLLSLLNAFFPDAPAILYLIIGGALSGLFKYHASLEKYLLVDRIKSVLKKRYSENKLLSSTLNKKTPHRNPLDGLNDACTPLHKEASGTVKTCLKKASNHLKNDKSAQNNNGIGSAIFTDCSFFLKELSYNSTFLSDVVSDCICNARKIHSLYSSTKADLADNDQNFQDLLFSLDTIYLMSQQLSVFSKEGSTTIDASVNHMSR